jgi:hypothetical protein
MARYRRDVSRDRYPVGLGGDPKNFGIGVPSGITPPAPGSGALGWILQFAKKNGGERTSGVLGTLWQVQKWAASN